MKFFYEGDAMLSIRRLFLLTLLLAVPAVALDDDQEFKPKSGSYSIRVPKAWKGGESPDRPQTQDTMTFTVPGEPHIIVVVSMMSVKMPLATLKEAAKSSMKEGGQKIENETDLKVDGRAAWRYDMIVEEQGKPKARVRQTVVDGPQCAMVVVGYLDPWPKALADDFQRIVSSFHILLKDEAATPLEFESKELLGGALRLEMPKGAEKFKEGSDGIEVMWKGRGLLFMAGVERSPLSLEAQADYEKAKDDSPTEEECVEIADRQEVKAAGGKALLQHAHFLSGGARVITISMVYQSTGNGEIASIGFGRLGDVPFDELKPLEEKLVKAEVKPHFAAPASEVPPLSQRVENAAGSSSISLPKGWVAGKAEPSASKRDGPVVTEKKVWGADRAMDLGVEVELGTMKGGKEGYQAWWWDKRYKKGENAKLSDPRAIKVGGQEGLVLEAEYGHEKDRWTRCTVLVFDGEGYFKISSACPVAVKKVYGGLAERVAATVEWAK